MLEEIPVSWVIGHYLYVFMVLSTARALLWIPYYWWEGREKGSCQFFNFIFESSTAIIFYNFACSLEEYCFNRESGYFGNTKFYDDIFHGFSHSCSPACNSKFLLISEQFNSYLQCIRASAKHMSQLNFMFFAQYLIHIWNKSKKNLSRRNFSLLQPPFE